MDFGEDNQSQWIRSKGIKSTQFWWHTPFKLVATEFKNIEFSEPT